MGSGKKKKFLHALKAISLIWAGSLAGGFLGFAVQILLARNFQPSDYGAFSSAFATINLLAPLCGFGVGSLWLRIYAQYGPNATSWIRPSLEFCALSTGLTFVVLILWACLGVHNSSEKILLFAMSPIFLWQLAVGLVSSKLQLEQRYGVFTYWQVSQYFFRLLGVAVLATLGFLTVYTASLLYAALAVGTFIFSFPHISKLLRKQANITFSPDLNYAAQSHVGIKEVWTGAWPFGFAGFFYLIYFQSNIIIINHIRSPADAGIYNVAFTILSALYLFPSAIYQKFLLARMHRWAAHSPHTLLNICRAGGIIMFGIGCGVGLAVYFSKDWLIHIMFGGKYSEAPYILGILCLCLPIRFYATAIGSALATQDHMRTKVKYMGFTALANIAINFALIPRFGLHGAAVATVFSEFTLLVLYRHHLKRHVFGLKAWDDWQWKVFFRKSP